MKNVSGFLVTCAIAMFLWVGICCWYDWQHPVFTEADATTFSSIPYFGQEDKGDAIMLKLEQPLIDPNLSDFEITFGDIEFVPATTAPSPANKNSILLWRTEEDGDFMIDVGSGYITIISDAERLRGMYEMTESMHAIICAPQPELVITDGKGDNFREGCFACVDPNYFHHFHYVWPGRSDK